MKSRLLQNPSEDTLVDLVNRAAGDQALGDQGFAGRSGWWGGKLQRFGQRLQSFHRGNGGFKRGGLVVLRGAGVWPVPFNQMETNQGVAVALDLEASSRCEGYVFKIERDPCAGLPHVILAPNEAIDIFNAPRIRF